MSIPVRQLVVAFAAACLALPAPARAATSQEVEAALEKAKAYIYGQMNGDNWETVPAPDLTGPISKTRWHPTSRQWGGTTAVAVYGLLAGGESSRNPKLRPAIDWLKKAQFSGNYAISMRAQVWPFLADSKEAKLAATADFRLLSRAMLAGDQKGLYSYYTDPATGRPQPGWWDRSVSQLCVLGMWSCEQAGMEISDTYWQTIDARWRKDQLDNGGWVYNNDRGRNTVTGTMTAAGIATLFITQDFLLQGDQGRWSRLGGGVRDEAIEKGLGWMDKNAAAMLKGTKEHYYYGMYGIERIGVASGRKYFGTTDWYGVGADELLKRQNPDGSWGNARDDENPKKIPDTVFSILFLSRGHAPVIMNKLEYVNQPDPKGPTTKPAANPWNQRPRDVANFTHWSGSQTERFLNWQVVNLQVSPDDIHDAPILYLSGSEPLNLGGVEVEKLRAYVEDGGLMLANADGGSPAFSKSYVALGKKLFPRYEFRELPANHPIYTDQQFRPANWRTKPKVLGLSNGVRELMLLIPDADAAKAWQTRSEKTKEELFQLVQNVFLYTISRSELRYRGETTLVRLDEKVKANKKINVARVLAGDNPDPEPGGWFRLASSLHNVNKLEVNLSTVTLGDGKLKDAAVAHFTGTTKFKLTAAQEVELKNFIAQGGTLIMDAAGGSSEFATAAETELAFLFGGNASDLGEVLESGHAVYNQRGARITRFGYRAYVKGRLSGRLNVPRVRALTVYGRPAVFYSREDLSAGLVGQPVDGVLGYDPATATAIMRNLILYAANPPAEKGAGGK